MNKQKEQVSIVNCLGHNEKILVFTQKQNNVLPANKRKSVKIKEIKLETCGIPIT